LNLDAAKAVGMHVIRMIDANQLERDLQLLGVVAE
jgi:hypothetical protein